MEYTSQLINFILFISTDLTSITQPESLDWEMAIAKVAKLILEEQTPARLLMVRSHLYDIITKCIQSSVIIKRLTFFLIDKMDEPMKLKVIERAAFHVSSVFIFIKCIRITNLYLNQHRNIVYV